MPPSDYVRFFILCGVRTGSNMLASALNYSPEIVCFREIFNTRVDSVLFYVEGYDHDSEADRRLRDNDFATFLETRIFVEHHGAAAVGFKLPYTHFLGVPGLPDWLVEQNLRVLHLRRRNLLRMLVSQKIAAATGAWFHDDREVFSTKLKPTVLLRAIRHPWSYGRRALHLLRRRPPAWKEQREQITLSKQECLEFFRMVTFQAKRYDASFKDLSVHTLFYEDLVEERKVTLDEARSLLGLAPRNLRISTGKQNPEPLHDLVANYDEIRRDRQGTRFEPFFD